MKGKFPRPPHREPIKPIVFTDEEQEVTIFPKDIFYVSEDHKKGSMSFHLRNNVVISAIGSKEYLANIKEIWIDWNSA